MSHEIEPDHVGLALVALGINDPRELYRYHRQRQLSRMYEAIFGRRPGVTALTLIGANWLSEVARATRGDDDRPTKRDAIDWRPLERLSDDHPVLEPLEEWMWMGYAAHNDIRIRLYKHDPTRKYLNLDAAGRAYRYAGGAGYERIAVEAAVADFLSE